MQLTRGRIVVWGSTERGERKAAVLAVLLARKARVYDVSAPDAPTTRSDPSSCRGRCAQLDSGGPEVDW